MDFFRCVKNFLNFHEALNIPTKVSGPSVETHSSICALKTGGENQLSHAGAEPQNMRRSLKVLDAVKMGVSKNNGTTKWMVYNGSNPMNKWMIWGGGGGFTPLFLETPK